MTLDLAEFKHLQVLVVVAEELCLKVPAKGVNRWAMKCMHISWRTLSSSVQDVLGFWLEHGIRCSCFHSRCRSGICYPQEAEWYCMRDIDGQEEVIIGCPCNTCTVCLDVYQKFK
jgi:hypothetical protein